MENDYFAHPTAVIDEGAQIGKGTKIWHFCHIMTGAVIGEGCTLGQNIVVAGDTTIGNNCKIQVNILICSGVHLANDVFCGPGVVFTNVVNPRSTVNRRNQYVKTQVGNGATIGANATIVCGHPIGKFAFIGAGTVVTKDVPDYALVVGNPARQLGWMSEFGHRLLFNDDGVAICAESNETYQLQNGIVAKISEQG